MLKMTGMATLKSLTPRIQFHGDQELRALTARLSFDEVSVEVSSAFVSQLGIMFDSKGDPLMPELAPLGLLKDLSNVEVAIGPVSIKGADVTDVVVTLKPKSKCSVDLKVNAVIDDALDRLHVFLGKPVKVKLTERQMEFAKLEGGLAPEPA